MMDVFPWLKARVRHLVMLNYETEARLLTPYVPRGVEIDLRKERCFVSIVGFLFTQPKVLNIPVPRCQEFEQVNLRFYVRRRTRNGTRRGVVFLCEFVPERLAALVARHVFCENYVCLPMAHKIHAKEQRGSYRSIEYIWHHKGNQHAIKVEADSNPVLPSQEGKESFFMERYWGYTLRPGSSPLEYRFAHPPWRFQEAFRAALPCRPSKAFGLDLGAELFSRLDSAFIASGSEVRLFLPRSMR